MSALASWVNGLPGLSKEQRDNLINVASASPEAAAAIEKTLTDAGRLPAELQALETKRQELEADFRRKETAVQELASTVKGHQGKVNKLYTQALAERDAALQKLSTVTTRVKATADVYGLDVEEILGKEEPVNPNNPNPPAPVVAPPNNEADPRYVRREELTPELEAFQMYPAALADLQAEYQELYGKPMPRGSAVKLVNMVRNAPKDAPINLRTAFDTEFKVAERRAEIDKNEREAEISRRVEEQVKIKTSELLSGNVPNQNPRLGHASPVLAFVNKSKSVSPQAIQSNDHVIRAAQAMDAKLPELVGKGA